MKILTSDALGWITRALGLTGAGAPSTDFFDGELYQTLDVNLLARRGRTQASTQGIYSAVLRNVHPGGGSLTTTVSPYEVGAGSIRPYPDPMPQQFDIWLIGAATQQVAGAGTFEGSLFVDLHAAAQGFGVDDSGNPIVVSNGVVVAFWDSVNSIGGVQTIGQQDGRISWQRIGMRLPRAPGAGTVLSFVSTASVAATFDCQMILGVFPVALGQDVIV